jgi:hypothetical protein
MLGLELFNFGSERDESNERRQRDRRRRRDPGRRDLDERRERRAARRPDAFDDDRFGTMADEQQRDVETTFETGAEVADLMLLDRREAERNDVGHPAARRMAVDEESFDPETGTYRERDGEFAPGRAPSDYDGGEDRFRRTDGAFKDGASDLGEGTAFDDDGRLF